MRRLMTILVLVMAVPMFFQNFDIGAKSKNKKAGKKGKVEVVETKDAAKPKIPEDLAVKEVKVRYEDRCMMFNTKIQTR